MKYKTIIICFVCILFCCSCDATYTVNFDERFNANEKVIINGTDDELKNSFTNVPINKDVNDYGAIKNKLDGVKYYDFIKKIDNIEFNYQFKKDDYFNNTIINNAFEYVTITDYNDYVLLSSSTGFLLYSYYPNLNNVSVVITSKEKLIETNADVVEKHKYTWNINKENASNKYIYLKLNNVGDDRTLWEKVMDGEFTNVFTVSLLIAFIAGIIFLILKRKGDRRNRI